MPLWTVPAYPAYAVFVLQPIMQHQNMQSSCLQHTFPSHVCRFQSILQHDVPVYTPAQLAELHQGSGLSRQYGTAGDST